MEEKKSIIPPTDEDAVTSGATVTEKDVIAALTEAEQNSAVSESQRVVAAEEQTITSEEDRIVSEVTAKRNGHVQSFQLDFSLDDIPDAEGMKRDDRDAAEKPMQDKPSPKTDAPVHVVEDEEEEETPAKPGGGCIAKIIFALIILAISGLLAYVGIKMFFGIFPLSSDGSDEIITVSIPEGANTQIIAETLQSHELIEDVWCFRLYSRLVKADGTWHAGEYELQREMGFATMIEKLQVAPPPKTVTVMLREGLTIDEMADILEEKGVCTKQEFLTAVTTGEYNYDFVKQIPTDGDNANRVYRLEGYLFPDTYEFYVDSSGEEVVNKMLSNFQSKLTDSLLDKIEKQGWTIDQAVTFASMVQGEGDTRANMDKISRVLHNRLAPKSGFKKLELCCTRDYANEMVEIHQLVSDDVHQIYNTYKCEGLPVGPICNPGMDALLAAVNPSQDSQIKKCYYFATDYKTGTTYFSKTYKEHQAIIKKYGIEDLG